MKQVNKQINAQYSFDHNSPQLSKRNTPETQMYFLKKNDYDSEAFSEMNIFQNIKMNHADYLSHWLELRDKFLYYRHAFNTMNNKMIQLFEEIKSQHNSEQRFNKNKLEHSRQFEIQNYLSKNKFSNETEKKGISYISDSLSEDNEQIIDFNSSLMISDMQPESNPFENTLQRELRLAKELSTKKKLINEVTSRRKKEMSEFNNFKKNQKLLFKRIPKRNDFHPTKPLFFKNNLSENLNIKKHFKSSHKAFKNAKNKNNLPYSTNMSIHSQFQHVNLF